LPRCCWRWVFSARARNPAPCSATRSLASQARFTTSATSRDWLPHHPQQRSVSRVKPATPPWQAQIREPACTALRNVERTTRGLRPGTLVRAGGALQSHDHGDRAAHSAYSQRASASAILCGCSPRESGQGGAGSPWAGRRLT
jgi:hypothetical protein